MISKLTIDNYALIDRSTVDFKNGFSVITGETGAGKSIMLDALYLLMGARADVKALGQKDRKTIIEAVFSNPDGSLKDYFIENGLDWYENELILRREISLSGRSRGFVNDSPVNLTVLSEISEKLIDIHSQHSNLSLSDDRQQLEIIDAFAGNESIKKEYQDLFKRYVLLRNNIKKAKEEQASLKENREFILFRLEQLDKLKPKNGELNALEKEFEILNDADRIKSGLVEAFALLDSNQGSAVKLLNNASNCLSGIDLSLFENAESEDLSERIDSLKIEIRDIADTLSSYIEKVNSDSHRLENVRERIESIYESMKYFKVKNEEELVDIHNRLKEDIKSIDSDGVELASWEKELRKLASSLKNQAEKLSLKREEASKELSKTLVERISPLGLSNVRFEIDIKKGKLGADGQDKVNFYCSFNKNHNLQPIAEIASGGEISRVMLGIKSIMAERMKLPTLILDEIDSGVSGEIAYKMGRLMKDMSSAMQVISVTHLPQVAASGAWHFKVYKNDEGNKTVSNIRELSEEERVMEIAGMLSGTEINETSKSNARILLDLE